MTDIQKQAKPVYTRWWFVALAVVVAVVVIAGVVGDTDSTKAARRVADSIERATDKMLSRSEFGDAWPLSVDSGEVECVDSRWAVIHASNGKTYALNGAAKSEARDNPKRGWHDIAEVWADDPAAIGQKKDIGVMLSRATSLCQ